MKGIILAGGTGSRMFPVTKAVNKHLLPVFDTPLIYFPLKTLKKLGVSEVLLITNPKDVGSFKALLGDGSEFGVSICYAIQERAAGIAQGIEIAAEWLEGSPFFLALGDNIFANLGQPELIAGKATAFLVEKPEADLCQFGVLNPDKGKIEEKPERPKSRLIATGLYFLPSDAVRIAGELQPSKRGELEITDLLNVYASRNALIFHVHSGEWFDCGCFESLNEAANVLRSVSTPPQSDISKE